MSSIVRNLVRRSKRLIRQIKGQDLWTAPQIRVPWVFIGSDYGGWSICPQGLNADSIVYGVGVGNDISFDLGMIKRFGVTVHAFDPTHRANQWIVQQVLPTLFHFHSVGLANFDGMATFEAPAIESHVSYGFGKQERQAPTNSREVKAPVKRLQTIMQELGHQHLDVLKIDIEGAEYGVIEDLTVNSVPIGQLLVEFHHGRFGHQLQDTRKAIDSLGQMGYRIFHISAGGLEYSFIHI